MSKKMLINASQSEESRVAIVEDGILAELDIEILGSEQAKGNIHKATVVRVEQGLQAAFVDYGADRMGFLQIGEIHPNLYPKEAQSGQRPRINDILKRGQEILVQIVREERDNKGAALTTFLSLAGRFMVLMPESDTKGVSRKIDNDSHRKKLKEAMAGLDIPDNMGYIVRTAGIGQKTAEMHRDFHYLIGTYNKILEISANSKAPQLVYRESNVVIRSIRDYFSIDMDEVLIDDPDVFREAQDFFHAVMPEHAHLLKLHQERRPIFSRYQIEEQIETLNSNKVPLPSGGSIVIDRTEALVAIDVNSGKMAGEHGIEATAFKTNMEAAAEVGRQLRLRDLGGLIVIDFIDMRERSHNRDVEKTLKNALKNDKARVSVGKISQFGLLEMSRQRIRAALAEGSNRACPNCGGSGKVKSPEAQALAFLRRIHSSCSKGVVEKVIGTVPTVVASNLLNAKRADLFELEKNLALRIEIIGQNDYISGQNDLQIIKREKQVDNKPAGPVAMAEFSAELSAAADASQPATNEPSVVPAPGSETSSAPTSIIDAQNERDNRAESDKSESGKRKRRRKRKTSTDTSEGNDTPETTGSESVAAEGETSAGVALDQTVEDETATGHEADTETGSDHAPEKKKRRRRRRRKSGAKAEATEDGSMSPVPASDEHVAEEHPVTETPAAEITSAEEIPAHTDSEHKKRPRRRRRKTSSATTPPAPEGIPATEVPPVSTEPSMPVDARAAVEAPKKPVRRRKPAPAKVTEPATAEPTADETVKKPARRKKVAVTDVPEPPVIVASETVPKKPVRRTTRPKAAEKSEGTPVEPVPSAPKRRSRAKAKLPPEESS